MMNPIMYPQFLTCPIFFFFLKKVLFSYSLFWLYHMTCGILVSHLLWLRLSILCWREVVRVGILVLFQIFSRKVFSIYHWILYWLWVCHKSILLCWDMFFLYSLLQGFIIMNGGWFLSNTFSASIEMVMLVLSFFFCWCGVSCWFQYTEPLSWPWNEFNLSHGVWPFLCVFGFCLLVWEFLCLYSSKLLAYNFLGSVFVWFWYQDDGFIDVFGSVPSSSVFWKSLRRIGVSFFCMFVEFPSEVIWFWTFVCFYYYRFGFISSDWSVQVICFFLVQFWWTVCF